MLEKLRRSLIEDKDVFPWLFHVFIVDQGASLSQTNEYELVPHKAVLFLILQSIQFGRKKNDISSTCLRFRFLEFSFDNGILNSNRFIMPIDIAPLEAE